MLPWRNGNWDLGCQRDWEYSYPPFCTQGFCTMWLYGFEKDNLQTRFQIVTHFKRSVSLPSTPVNAGTWHQVRHLLPGIRAAARLPSSRTTSLSLEAGNQHRQPRDTPHTWSCFPRLSGVGTLILSMFRHGGDPTSSLTISKTLWREGK